MSKNSLQIKSAINSLNIKKPYDLRAQMRPKFQPPQNEVAQIKEAEIEQPQDQDTDVGGGFFMLAHSLFLNPLVRALSGDAKWVFTWMSSQAWRFKQSKGEFRAAVDYIVLKSGCSRSTVSRVLRDLKDAGLIECVEQNFHKGNLWKVSDIANGRGKGDSIEDTQIEVAQNKSPQNGSGASSDWGSSRVKLSREHAQNEHHIINPNKNLNNSQEAAGEVAEALEERKMIWLKFCEAFPNEDDQKSEIQKRLIGSAFLPTQEFARDMAVMRWWEGNID